MYIYIFPVIPVHWHGACTLNPTIRTKETKLSFMSSTLLIAHAANALAPYNVEISSMGCIARIGSSGGGTQGVSASAALLLSYSVSSQWRHNEHDSVSNHQPHDCLLKRLFGRRSKITSKLRVTGLCVGNSPGTGEFPAQMASNAENVSIWWRHHVAPMG